MNASNHFAFALSFLMILYSCQSSSQETNGARLEEMNVVHEVTHATESESQQYQNNHQHASSQSRSNSYVYIEDVDSKTGMVTHQYPFPKSWKKSQQAGYLYEGPNNIRVSGVQSLYFDFTNNQDVLMNWQYQGIQNVSPLDLDQIIEYFFMPNAQQAGRTLVNSYQLPELARTRVLYHNQRFHSVPTQWDAQAYVLEWQDKSDMRYASILVKEIGYAQVSSGWFLINQQLEAPKEYYEEAKDALIYALTYYITNPDWVRYINERDAQQADVQLQAHLNRMAAINARISSNQSIGDIYSEISDISHAGYLKRSDMNIKGHNSTIDMIGERTLIGNQTTGEQYYVPSGNNYYWVNKDGAYISTNNSLFDPRTDQRLNQMEWEKFQKQD